MSDCSHLDSRITPFVDGELPPDEQQALTGHVAACPACRAAVAAERAVRTLIASRRAELTAPTAPSGLKARCSAVMSAGPAPVLPMSPARPAARASRWRDRVMPLAMAATLVLMVGGAFLYTATRASTRVLAAELAMDHEKCLRLNRLLGTNDSPAAVEASMASIFDWSMRLPDTAAHEDVSLVGSRPCLYGEGKVAHIMFTYDGQLVSLFMLPRESRRDQVVAIFGHEARIWSDDERTFVLVSRESTQGMDRMAALVRTTIR
jgi:anti-sigma factor (TIGR02949 family)